MIKCEFVNNNSLGHDVFISTMVVTFVLFSPGLEFAGGEDKLKTAERVDHLALYIIQIQGVNFYHKVVLTRHLTQFQVAIR